MKKYLFLIVLVCLTASCRHSSIVEGRYVIASFSAGTQGNLKSLVSDPPVFVFKGNQMKVSPDFYFGLFEDSVYRYSYQYEDCVLNLRGKHQQMDLRCKPYCGGYEISLDSDILKSFLIIPREKE